MCMTQQTLIVFLKPLTATPQPLPSPQPIVQFSSHGVVTSQVGFFPYQSNYIVFQLPQTDDQYDKSCKKKERLPSL